jgi:hypothetical protein
VKPGRPRHLTWRREVLILNLAFVHRGPAHDPVALILTPADMRLIVDGGLIHVSIIEHDRSVPDVVEGMETPHQKLPFLLRGHGGTQRF